jgi:thiol-disulfide isomerase/thioredoxin
MRGRMLLVLGLLLAVGGRGGRADELTIGDKAPALSVSKWVKGESLGGLEPGKVHVVEFWATWCGPCRTSIPHLTELQKQHPDVNFIGVSIWEDDPKGVEPFVKEMGNKMEYRVALDLVPEGKSGNDGKMATDWMQAAGESGIPSAFLIDGSGTIAWIGHPMALDEPLKKVLAGNWDIADARKERTEAKEREKKLAAFFAKLQGTGNPKDAAQFLPEIDSLIAEEKELESSLGLLKFNILMATDEAKAVAQARKLAETAFADNPLALNNMAWTLLGEGTERKPSKEALAAGRDLATKACELTENSQGMYLDTLALAQFLGGDPKTAVATQRKAVELAGDEADEGMKERLERFEKAAKEEEAAEPSK